MATDISKPSPIKRHKILQPVSREHHHTLLLVWKIRKGFNRKVAIERISLYVKWFFENHVFHHFEFEEKYLYPILVPTHPMLMQALKEHQKIKEYYFAKNNIEQNLLAMADLLESHIRFEEREMFNEIQNYASESQFQLISKHTSEEKFIENESDKFWE